MRVLICGRKKMNGKFCYASAFSLLIWLPCIVWGSPIPPGVTSGDLVFRTGDEAISAVVRTVDSSGFSHVGMLYLRNGEPFVIHSTPAEHEGTKDGVVMDSLDFYISRAINRTVSYYHVKSDKENRKQAVERALTYVGTPFSVVGGEGVYCTELVAQAWKEAGVKIISGTTEINLPGLREKIIFPENLIQSDNVVYIGSTSTNGAL
ncbi:Uncharacterized distant relative of cell wall-associated hydrolases [Serratia ficaria]|nr:Uncharacterized distant relative of cell wall-associated hydrolases [Serratia ficaria]